MSLLDLVFALLPPSVILTHLYFAPYTKVEESFSLQAIHDLTRHGIPASADALARDFDHALFPGAVPRSFLGPLALTHLSAPLSALGLNAHINEQLLVRATLGLLVSAALVFFAHRVRRVHGTAVARVYTLLQLSQFHLPYYASRTLPNTFALLLSIVAHGCFIGRGRAMTATGFALLTAAAVVFRAELALLLAVQLAVLVFTRRTGLWRALVACATGGVAALALTLRVDSHFWQAAPAGFATPLLTRYTGLIWPEMSAFVFNAVHGGASAWGTAPWHHYFTAALPKLLLNPISLVTIPLGVVAHRRAAAEYLLPALWFVAAYSLLPHKEWRFVVYVVPQLTLLSALGGVRLARHPLGATALAASIAASATIAAGMLAISSLNYPGGAALNALHSHLPVPACANVVHMDVPVCMTGASRFLQERPLWPTATGVPQLALFDKTENATTLLDPMFWEPMEWVLTATPERVIGKYDVVQAVPGLKRVRLYKPGETVRVGVISPAREAAAAAGLRAEAAEEAEQAREAGEAEHGWWEKFRLDGLGLRALLRGWWVGVEMEEMVWILRRVDGQGGCGGTTGQGHGGA
ncbi:Alg9-like mannosyltransferase family-domain-containing protein [Geopyxis carbonaria]|nr:Alg9-like mannosyltransferase family-domain-containing protein [Geopyxis carbonaria]